ncbi:hypothetical protein MMC25_007052 [Agyrium rufum]|nr:hypothetical protein [Agyrium rufum]
MDDLVRQEPKAIESTMQQHMNNKTGPLTQTGVASYAYLPLLEFFSEGGQHTLQMLLNAHAPADKATTPSSELYYGISRALLEIKSEGCGSFFTFVGQAPPLPSAGPGKSSVGPLPGKFLSIGAMLSQPSLSHPLDLEIYARIAQYIETIAISEPLSSFLVKGGRRAPYGSHLTDLDAAKAYVQDKAFSMWHPTSTCSMMPREMGGVVNERLLVHGASSLRVVDASIMPLIPVADIQSTVHAVAERAADTIVADHSLAVG